MSTIFLGIDHHLIGDGPPILFETMVLWRRHTVKEVFGKLMSSRRANGKDLWRYVSWDDALTGHRATLRRLQK